MCTVLLSVSKRNKEYTTLLSSGHLGQLTVFSASIVIRVSFVAEGAIYEQNTGLAFAMRYGTATARKSAEGLSEYHHIRELLLIEDKGTTC